MSGQAKVFELFLVEVLDFLFVNLAPSQHLLHVYCLGLFPMEKSEYVRVVYVVSISSASSA